MPRGFFLLAPFSNVQKKAAVTTLACVVYLAPFFFLVGDFSELADPGCCDFFG